MKRHPISSLLGCALLALSLHHSLHAQEFTLYPNGLIYDPGTIASLRYLVDSVHLRFRNCGTAAQYHADQQTVGRYIRFEGDEDDLEEIMKAMDRRAGWDDILRSFASINHESDSLPGIVVRKRWQDWFKHDIVSFNDPVSEDRLDLIYADSLMATNGMAGSWIYQYHDSHYSGTTLTAFYLAKDFTTPPLPPRYAQLVQYADCLVDTTSPLYLAKWEAESPRLAESMERLREMMETEPMPEYDEDQEHWSDSMNAWANRREHYINQILGNRREFVELVAAAAKMAIEDSVSDPQLEDLAIRFLSPSVTFELMRRRRPIGRCSRDESPRRHACGLAARAARLGRWDLFLRAHLDVMNDRFDRMSDGSYAWGERRTYIREVEELGIDVHDLLFGISLGCSDAGGNHYVGSIRRLGRAFVESREAEAFERRALQMIHDPELDDYNRTRIYWLYVNYAYSLDREACARHITAMKETIDTYPLYLRGSIAALELTSEER